MIFWMITTLAASQNPLKKTQLEIITGWQVESSSPHYTT
jgi:hypothetical protein